MYNKSDVCAIIVSYNIGTDLLKCFDSIYNQVNEVVIVDNGSDMETISVLNGLEQLPNVKIFYNKENRGIATALNEGIKYAIENKYEWIVTLDHDSVATENMIERMLTIYESMSDDYKKSIGMICPQIYDINAHKYLTNDNSVNNNNEYVEVKTTLQSGCLIKTCVFEKVDYFNESLFIYFVDDDFCYRLINSGFKIVRIKSVVLYHEEGKKEKKKLIYKTIYYDNYNKIAIYYIARNCVYMIRRYNRKYLNRIIKDFIKIILFDTDKYEKIKFFILGIYDGFKNRFGKFEYIRKDV